MKNVLIGIGIGLATLFATGAQAKTQADILIEWGNCNLGCDSQSRSCSAGCCGLIFCRRSCIGGCDATEDSCKNDCAAAAVGAPSSGNFVGTAVSSPRGRSLRVSGPLVCPKGATADVDVLVAQESSAAVGVGGDRVRCTAGETTFTAVVQVDGKGAFQPASEAHACATARIHARGKNLQVLHWCQDITVLPEGVGLED